jgi:predicted O-methyltransferase YrrM
MSNKSFGLPAHVYDYLLSVSLRESPILARLRAETAKLPMSMMQIAPEQGQLLACNGRLGSSPHPNPLPQRGEGVASLFF